MSRLAGLIRALRWAAGFAVMGAAVLLGSTAFAAQNGALFAWCALLALALLYPLSHALAEELEDLWRWNEETSLLPSIARDILRVINRRMLWLATWQDEENAARGAYDPLVESLLEKKAFHAARAIATERLHGAHSAGDERSERMYRRYVTVVDRMGKDEAA